MGFFDKLFGKRNSDDNCDTTLSKTDQMLDEDLYWQIVQESIDKTSNQDDQETYLISRIFKLSPNQIIGFRLRTDRLLYDTYNSEMWCAAYLINGGCSDDGFEYFRCWVISRGKKVYYNAKENPDSLVSQIAEDSREFEFESFWYVANTALINKTGKDLYDYIDDDFKFTEGKYPKIVFTWEAENPESMKIICPKIFDKMEE